MRQQRRRIRLSVVILAVVLIAVSIATYRSFLTEIRSVDGEFTGLQHPLAEGKTVRLLIVHGIGPHCPGYADSLIRGLVAELGLDAATRYGDLIVQHAQRIAKQENGAAENGQTGVAAGEQNGKEAGPAEVLIDDKCRLVSIAKNELTGGHRRRGMSLPQLDYDEFEIAKEDTCEELKMPPTDSSEANGQSCYIIELRLPDHRPPSVRPEEFFGNPLVLGFIREQVFSFPTADNRRNTKLHVYEFTWDSATRWAKNYHLSYDQTFVEEREYLNNLVKEQLISERISDAVMYIGGYGSAMRLGLIFAMCNVLVGPAPPENDRPEGPCNFPKLKAFAHDPDAITAFQAQNEVIIVTHSLGTRMVFDTLGQLSREGFLLDIMAELAKYGTAVLRDGDNSVGDVSKRMSEIFDGLREPLFATVGTIFAFANQVPLLDLSVTGHPSGYASFLAGRGLGADFERFLELRAAGQVERASAPWKSPLHMVSFTDEDDVLSYNLKCWYLRNVVRHKYKHEIAGIAEEYRRIHATAPNDEPVSGMSNVFTSFYARLWAECLNRAMASGETEGFAAYDRIWALDSLIDFVSVNVSLKGARVPWLFVDPAAAHGNYFNDRLVFNLIACGVSTEREIGDPCRVLETDANP